MNHWYTTSSHAAVLRGSIGSVHHASIDVSLKELRHVSRRATAFSTPYHNELQLLERIYYKGKNQHRSALFWRKVLEMRRLGIRIGQMNFPGLVEDLRYAFYGTEDRSNPQILRCAWKQTPGSSSCAHLLSLLRSLCLLFDKVMQKRTLTFHRAFIQQIRTATFIPLAMSLISIASRLDFLVCELREMSASLWQAVVRILDTIAVSFQV
ncbi:hypothetical protein JB92DRAFT_2735747 [Gautieria morchelliformis]|nr:hypothetical protein JB92DRAFT_2735747 [Gautieria morchelliformis]